MDNKGLDKIMKENWLVWSLEHQAWWKPARRGYTALRSEAGRYTFTEAEEIVRMANRYHLEENAPPFEAMVPEDLP